jgi:hypothetical protein
MSNIPQELYNAVQLGLYDKALDWADHLKETHRGDVKLAYAYDILKDRSASGKVVEDLKEELEYWGAGSKGGTTKNKTRIARDKRSRQGLPVRSGGLQFENGPSLMSSMAAHSKDNDKSTPASSIFSLAPALGTSSLLSLSTVIEN